MTLRAVFVLLVVCLSRVPPAIAYEGDHGKSNPADVAREIDRRIESLLAARSVEASPLADDAVFVRRVWLDIAGRIPPIESAVNFLDNNDTDKRRKLIDSLLANPDYGQHFATRWTNLIDATGSPPFSRRQFFFDWIAKQFNEGRGWDETVRGMVASEGIVAESPGSWFIRANVREPARLAETTSRFFLGVQIQCAECHDHPFQSWTQQDFWGMAAFYSRIREVRVKGGKNLTEEPDPKRKPIADAPDGAFIALPQAGKDQKPRFVIARLLAGPQPEFSNEGAIRPRLAQWITSADNPYFARAAVNRMWAHFFGRGFFSPVDGFKPDETNVHDELLSWLGDEFARSQFDLKHLIRCITLSRVYQRTSRPVPSNNADQELFSHMTIKVMRPEVMYASILSATGQTKLPGGLGSPIPFEIYAGDKGRARRLPADREFIRFFETQDVSEPAIKFTHGIPQILALMNADQFNQKTPLLGELVKNKTPRDDAIERLFLGSLSRRPTKTELQRFGNFIDQQSDHATGYAGVLWALLNCSEFVLNH